MNRNHHSMFAILAVLAAMTVLAACMSATDTGRPGPEIVQTWVNATGLPQLDAEVWQVRLDRACEEGVWDDDVARDLAIRFVVEDLPLVVHDLGAPTASTAAEAVWIMAVNHCRGDFPAGEIEDGTAIRESSMRDLVVLLDRLSFEVTDPAPTVVASVFGSAGRHDQYQLTVDGHDLWVYDFDNTSEALQASWQVSHDGYGIAGSQYEWIATPHFWKWFDLIVRYLGDAPALVDRLDAVLGVPITD